MKRHVQPRRLPRAIVPLVVIAGALAGSNPSQVALAAAQGAIDGERKKVIRPSTQLSAREGKRGSGPLRQKTGTSQRDEARRTAAEEKRQLRAHKRRMQHSEEG
jgi:hypothetical protein